MHLASAEADVIRLKGFKADPLMMGRVVSREFIRGQKFSQLEFYEVQQLGSSTRSTLFRKTICKGT